MIEASLSLIKSLCFAATVLPIEAEAIGLLQALHWLSFLGYSIVDAILVNRFSNTDLGGICKCARIVLSLFQTLG